MLYFVQSSEAIPIHIDAVYNIISHFRLCQGPFSLFLRLGRIFFCPFLPWGPSPAFFFFKTFPFPSKQNEREAGFPQSPAFYAGGCSFTCPLPCRRRRAPPRRSSGRCTSPAPGGRPRRSSRKSCGACSGPGRSCTPPSGSGRACTPPPPTR